MTDEKARDINDIIQLLVDKAYQIIDWKTRYATTSMLMEEEDLEKAGLPTDYHLLDQGKMNEIVDMVKPLMKTAEQVKKLQAESVRDVVSLLKNGKISVGEARQLMEMMEKKAMLDVLEEMK